MMCCLGWALHCLRVHVYASSRHVPYRYRIVHLSVCFCFVIGYLLWLLALAPIRLPNETIFYSLELCTFTHSNENIVESSALHSSLVSRL